MRLFGSRKNKDLLAVAKLISRVFDPILVIPLMLVLSAWAAFVNGERWRFLTLLIFLDAVLPGFVQGYFIQKGKILSGWDVKHRKERVPLFVFVVLCHLVGVMAAWFLGKHPLAEYLSSFWVLTVLYTLITSFWKISVHSGVMSAMVTFLVLTQSPIWAGLYALVLLVIWARVVGQYHRLSQALAGAALPVLVLPVGFWWFGII